MNILALDLSATKCGVAFPDGTTDRLAPPRQIGTGGHRLAWWQLALANLLADHAPDLVAVEAPAHVDRATTFILGKTRGILDLEAVRGRTRPVIEIMPTTIKLAATGNGRSSKAKVLAAAAHHLDDPDLTDDEADAWWLREIAMQAVSGSGACHQRAARSLDQVRSALIDAGVIE